jgi:hypothetical protein
MERLAKSLGPSAHGALLHKRLLVTVGQGDIAQTRKVALCCPPDHPYSFVIRYQAASAEVHHGDFRAGFEELLAVAKEYLQKLGLNPKIILFKNPPELLALMAPTANIVDIHHLADCYSEIYKIGNRKPEVRPRLAIFAVWAMKFYSMSGAIRSALVAGQDYVDIMLREFNDPEGARRFLTEILIPAALENPLPDLVTAIRAQYAVVCAHCGDFKAAEDLMVRLLPYADSMSAPARAEIYRQRDLIESLRARGPLSPELIEARRRELLEQHARADDLRQRLTATTSSVGKASRNAPCPCGSGKKFKKCHGLG